MSIPVTKWFLILGLCLFSLNSYAQNSDTETTSNYLPNMGNFTTSGGTNTGSGVGCSSGNYCTAGKQGPGGTYTSTFDFKNKMTTDQINKGFDMNYGVDVKSHSSNSTLLSCVDGNTMQNSDCRDIFNLTVTLLDSISVVHKFEHEVELDFTGLRSFSFSQTIPENNFINLQGQFELFGIDAGFPNSFFGPSFSNPFLTSTFNLISHLESEVLNIIDSQENIQTVEVQDIAIQSVQEQQLSAVTTIEEIETIELNSVSVEPVETTIVEAQQEVEVEVQQEIQVATVVTVEEIQNVDLDSVSVEPVETTTVEEVEVQQEVEVEVQQEVEVEVSEPQPEPETTREDVSEPEEQPKTKAEVKKSVAQKVRNKVVKKIMNRMGDKGKYDSTNQIRTLAVMGILGSSKNFFDTQVTLQDTPGFFSGVRLDDGSIQTNNVAQYLMFGGSNQMHSQMVDSQWQK